MKNAPILILGAGPAGLSLGHELEQRGLKYRILEKASEVGNTFYRMTDSTEYGPWLNNTLPGSPMPLSKLFARTTRSEYARYLSQYRHDHNLVIDTNTSVIAARSNDEGFEVETDQGVYQCQVLVNATGYYSTPFTPDFPGLEEANLETLHSADYVSPLTVSEKVGKTRAKILIVGSRLSAGELMEELHKVGHQIQLSHRSKLKYWPSPTEEALLSPFSMSWERLALKLRAPKPSNLKPRLRRGFQKSLLDDGIVKTRPNIKEIRGRTVEFEDGETDDFDLVLFCTGYLPTLAHLWPLLNGEKPKVSNLESKTTKNLFFMGYENSRNFRSQFLRGIRDDARYLGEVLEDRLSKVDKIHIKTTTAQASNVTSQEVKEAAGAETT
jgi:putative flavoprotein involved in K+ transport